MEERYVLKKGEIAMYELEIMKKGCCRGLAPGSFFERESDYVITPELSGLENALGSLKPKGSELFSGYRPLLSLVRKTLEAIVLAEDFLVPSAHISLAPEELLIDSEGNVRLVLRPQGGRLSERLVKLLAHTELIRPGMHAAHLASLLPDYADAAFLLRKLSLIELELLR